MVYVVCCCLHEVGSRAQATLHQSCQYAWGKGGVHVQGGRMIGAGLVEAQENSNKCRS